MRSLFRSLLLAVMCVVVAAGMLPAAAADAEADQSNNVKKIASFPYKNKEADFFQGGTDMDFQGKFIYAMQQGPQGGIHIFDGSKATPKKLGFFKCPGGQNDIAVVKKGLVALGYHETQCGGPTGGGVRLVDVRDPNKTKLLGVVNDLPEGTHTLTTYPGKPIIYASPGGLPTNGGAVEQILGRPVSGGRLFYCTAAGGLTRTPASAIFVLKRSRLCRWEVQKAALRLSLILTSLR